MVEEAFDRPVDSSGHWRVPEPRRTPVARAGQNTATAVCVVGAEWTFAPVALSASRAREAVGAALCAVHGERASSAVTLAASEFLAHAFRCSANGPVHLAMRCQVATVMLTATYPAETSEAGNGGLWLFDEVSTWVIQGISRSSGSGPVDGGWGLWCQIPTGFMPGPAR